MWGGCVLQGLLEVTSQHENLAKCKLDLPSHKAIPPPLSPFPICQLNQNPGISRQVFSLSPILQ